MPDALEPEMTVLKHHIKCFLDRYPRLISIDQAVELRTFIKEYMYKKAFDMAETETRKTDDTERVNPAS